MPLVRIAHRSGRGPGFGRAVGESVHRAMVETINVHPKDVFQVITEHGPDGLIYDPSYLDISRSDGIVRRLRLAARGPEREHVLRQRRGTVRVRGRLDRAPRIF